MIDTPRTDAMICNPALNQLQYVSAVFARQLERELNEANRWKRAFEGHVRIPDDEYAKECQERDQLRADFRQAEISRTTNAELLDRALKERDQLRAEVERLELNAKELRQQISDICLNRDQLRECAERLADIMFCVNKQSAYYSENRQEAVNALAAFNKLKGETI